ncbi:hypothetical protein BD410DRAFT_347400 [Rickenella mellea]|uniref:Uncharacterized protein n=1 Tax=Rickenella mellea TaxID=50990 RepID=A0A4Y7QKG7_9AGAM|nr:hypothetical protein BD410DRAFT_347400 [Rickenella mellea]
MRINNAAAAQPRTNGPASSSSLFDLGNREIHAVPPPTELLNRVQAFLPQIEAANANLAHQAQLDPASIDIENIDDGQYIEMNLGLGVFDMRQPVTSSSPSARTTPDHQANTSDDAHSDSDSSSSSGTSSSDHHSTSSHPVQYGRCLDAANPTSSFFQDHQSPITRV